MGVRVRALTSQAHVATGRLARPTCTTRPTTRRRCAGTARQAVAWQTGINPVVALELIAEGTWSGAGVLGPEAFDAVPFLDRLRAKGEEWKVDDRSASVQSPRLA